MWNKHKHKKKKHFPLSCAYAYFVCFTSVNIRETSISKEHNTQSTLRTRIFHFLVLILRVWIRLTYLLLVNYSLPVCQLLCTDYCHRILEAIAANVVDQCSNAAINEKYCNNNWDWVCTRRDVNNSFSMYHYVYL